MRDAPHPRPGNSVDGGIHARGEVGAEGTLAGGQDGIDPMHAVEVVVEVIEQQRVKDLAEQEGRARRCFLPPVPEELLEALFAFTP